MELYLPSLLILALAAILVFGVIPRLAPFLLAVVAALMLAVVAYEHAATFRAEYTESTWQTMMYNFSYPFLIAMLVLFCLGFLLNFVRGSTASVTTKAPNVKSNISTAEVLSLMRNPLR
jgi:ABC-type transport system involved in multi-copper enzyme maturation permease subunit